MDSKRSPVIELTAITQSLGWGMIIIMTSILVEQALIFERKVENEKRRSSKSDLCA